MAIGFKKIIEPKNLIRSILLIVIIVLIALLIYKLTTQDILEDNVEGFTVSFSNNNIFGNYLSYIDSVGLNNTYNINLGSSNYRIETIQVPPTFDYTTLKIEYSNSGNSYNIQKTKLSTNIYDNLNIYTSNLKLSFDNNGTNRTNRTIPQNSKIIIYGMKLGDYNKEYYFDNNINSNFPVTTSGDNLPSENNQINLSLKNHYMNLGNENKLIKGINYKYSLATPTQITISISYKNINSNSIYDVVNKNGSVSEFKLNPTSNVGTIFFSVPVLANILILKTPLTPNNLNFIKSDTNAFGKIPDFVETKTYAIPNYISSQSRNLAEQCPSIDVIASNQNITQQICDDLDVQDKLRMEQIKLEKEKQYLVKLRKQDDEIKNLQEQINSIEASRKNKDFVLDNLRLAQFQKQREEAVQLRDIASEQLARQKNNTLNFDVNLIEEEN
jgi:hypothetical protein